jgi:cellulose synthase/poly-beta-1,6-N-acetylglucosamine synthase-like glycosyltransferase
LKHLPPERSFKAMLIDRTDPRAPGDTGSLWHRPDAVPDARFEIATSNDVPPVGFGSPQGERTLRSGTRKPWLIAAAVLAIWAALFAVTVAGGLRHPPINTAGGWLAAGLLHLPYIVLVLFLMIGACERIGYFFRGRAPSRGGCLPDAHPRICVQLPMFNEEAVATRVIEAAAALIWPRDRLTVQVLDDSTDDSTRLMVRGACARIQDRTGVTIDFIHRTDRTGYKAGALEAGRHRTDAEFIAIFDADFLPPPDYLLRAVPHFYNSEGRSIEDLALVQAQWGHLNDDESFLTAAQALWVDDHHTLQKSWRSAAVGFVNFTGTAGLWRATAIQAAGGWKSASLVEDCELSFRALFAGYRTKFVKEIVVPAELPQTFTAYRLQQKRWTQGWAQLQRLHFATLMSGYRTGWPRKAYLANLMCISWQWPLWFAWIAVFPFAIAHGLSFAALGTQAALTAYVLPPLAFAVFAALIATVETKHTYAGHGGGSRTSAARRIVRLMPYLVVNTAMIAHHVCAFCEGLFGPMHCEFERTPKTASVTASAAGPAQTAAAATPVPQRRKAARLAYLLTETVLVVTQLGWLVFFLFEGAVLAAAGAAWLVACVIGVRLAPGMSTLRARSLALSPRAAV